MRRLLLAVAVLALAAPAANADTLDTQLQQLQPIAAQWWAAQGHTATRCDTVLFTHAPMTDGTWANTLEGSDLAHPQWPDERIPVCHVVFSDALANDPQRRCAAVLHETGHLLGLDHTTDPTDIMYGSDLVIPPTCAPPVKGQARVLPRGRRQSRRHIRAVMALLR